MNQTTIKRNNTYKTITVERTFLAPKSRVFAAWTTCAMLEKWWAPKPWVAVTKAFNFSEGGQWLYCMKSPDGDTSWSLVSYDTIEPESSFTATTTFCDEEGNDTSEIGSMHWNHEFYEEGDTTKVFITITFESAADMNTIIEMGFEEGFQMGLSNLDELLAE